LGRLARISAYTRPLHISIGNVSMSLNSSDQPLLQQARIRYRDFPGSRSDGFQITLNRPANPSPSPPNFEYCLRGSRLRVSHSKAEFIDVAHEYALDSLIRILLTVALLPKDGFLLHAASVVREGKAHVFVGRSGAGKSTVASLSPEGTVLTDEISLLRKTDGVWRAHGTPFWGEFRAGGINESYPVAAIHCLVQAAETRLEPIRPKDLLRAILPCVLFFSSGTEANGDLLNILMLFAQSIPCFRLHFRKDPSFWGAIAQ